MSAPYLKPTNLIAIDKLKKKIEHYLTMTTIVEPNNAMAAIEVRMMVTGTTKLNRLPRPSSFLPFVPYEWNLPVVISVRATGGNADNALAGQAALINLQLANMLENEFIEVRDVSQILQVPQGLQQLGPENKLKIVGDAELTDAKFQQSGFTGNKETDNFDAYDGPFVYREDWTLTMTLTVHREFFSPTLTEITFYNPTFDSEIVIPPPEDETA